ncbi:hypothetical protein BD410DRAFT_782962 [Rickenella mellea]|uniref:RING-CH-type domain-containing protein n=1 Tax=Rickenella mellea TaxID=50990 RepID=A0A4Y7QGR2_9AGAM|nr:hypothetical protein BD410DRAFT_782962 [Rickenella mellea]
MARRVLTVDDLRVKLCFICREEETHDKPEIPPRKWVHPCKCTLIAHESCLLEWIGTAESNQDRTPESVRKCPQCGSKYEVYSNYPLILQYMDMSDVLLSMFGRAVTFVGVGAIVFSFGAGIYAMSTAYGAMAIQNLVGDEMYHLLLTDDPTNWPFHAWINLPLIPISLICSQIPSFSNPVPLHSILTLWPSVPPVVRPPSTSSYLGSAFGIFGGLQKEIDIHSRTLGDLFFSWPPSPLMINVAAPFVRVFYRVCFRRFSHWVMGTTAPARVLNGRRQPIRRIAFGDLHMEFRLDGREEPARMQPAPPARLPVGPPEAMDEGIAPLERPANVPVVAPPEGAQAIGAGAGQDGGPLTIHLTLGKIGRIIGGALLLPFISNKMGAALFRLSKHSSLLRRFLAVHPHGGPIPVHRFPPSFADSKNPVRQLGSNLWVITTLIGCGSPAWTACDPVWWRNTVGLGIYLVAKDCVGLWYNWLSDREIQSRRLKDRAFDDVDPAELDLITP